jgi:pimeloyl-ACP methyl ester carboxylesterase
MTQRLGRLAADIHGDRSTLPALVLLHGLTFDRSMWRPVREALPSRPPRVTVAFDLPGHGDSDPQPDYSVEAVAATVHDAVTEGDLDAPVIVGHSVSGLIATFYAAQYPTRGIINVDQPLDITAFANLVRSLEHRLRGPDFDELWAMFAASFHTELLPDATRPLARSHARQDLVLSYWNRIFELPVATLNTMIEDALTTLHEQHVRYTFVSGDTIDPTYQQWLTMRLPHAQVIAWPDGTHFPHLARPAAFAHLLGQTADW